jgi:hypothetical protein
MIWALWRDELLDKLPFHLTALLLAIVGLYLALRRWRHHRLGSALLITSVVLLFGVYTALQFVGELNVVFRGPFRSSEQGPRPPFAEHLADICAAVTVVAAGLALLSLVTAFCQVRGKQGGRSVKRALDYETPNEQVLNTTIGPPLLAEVVEEPSPASSNGPTALPPSP